MTTARWDELAQVAWNARSNAHIVEKIKVGAAALADDGTVFPGCNVEHRFRCHDVHAEVNAISTMVAAGKHRLVAILVASEMKMFTPCGGCLDWIQQFGGDSCLVAYQSGKQGKVNTFRFRDLMPYYPK